MDQKQLIQTELTMSTGTVCNTLCTYFNIEFSFSWKIKRHEFIHWKFYPAWCFCGLKFALRNILTFKLNFWVQIYFCVLCDSRVRKGNSEFNLGCGFWPHPMQAAHVLITITCKSKKNCISLGVYNKNNFSISSWADWWFLYAIQCLKISYIVQCLQFYSVLW